MSGDSDRLPLTSGEMGMIKSLISAWPSVPSDIALDVNAVVVGRELGLDGAQVHAVVASLQSKGLLHARDIQGLLLVHPTAAARERFAARRGGLLGRVIRAIHGLGS